MRERNAKVPAISRIPSRVPARAPRGDWLAMSATLALVAASFVAAAPAAANPMGNLAGRWSGWGSVVLTSGDSEQVKCVATYFLQKGGAAVRQNLRCASSSYKIDASATYEVDGDRVSGEWTEKTWSAVGSVSGRMTGNGFRLAIRGRTFSAAMAVTTTACKQSIQIAPQGFDVAKISIGLGRC